MQQLNLDESIIPWRGKLNIREYNAGKIIKYRLLVRMVSEATSGYICNGGVYCGRKKSHSNNNIGIRTIYKFMAPCIYGQLLQ